MIIVFSFVGQTTPVKRIFIKILCMPLVAGISFEVFRLPVKFPNSVIVKALVAPGLWTQRLTTKEPTADQLEVAIAALTAVPGFVPSFVPKESEVPAVTEMISEKENTPVQTTVNPSLQHL